MAAESLATDRRAEVLTETLRKFLRREARANIAKLLGRVRAEDVALLLPRLEPAEQLEVLRVLASELPDGAGHVLTELDPPQRLALLEQLSPEETAAILERIPIDDAVYLVEALPADLQERVLALIDLRDLAAVQVHLSYRDDTAGRIMDTEFFALAESVRVREAVAAIQEQRDVEMIFYLYVVDAGGHLVGVTSLRHLILSPPEQTLAAIMTRTVIKVHTDTDQEEVAQLAARYDLLAIPVTDDANRLVGIVTVDDIVDVVKEEAAEDLMKMAGTSEDELLYERQPLKVAGLRLRSLLVSMVGLLATGLLLETFQAELMEALFLLVFVPVIMGLGGTVGSQAAAVTVRGLASGRIGGEERPFVAFLGQQLRVAAILGGACGLAVGLGAMLLRQSLYYGVVVGVALFLALVVAMLAGVTLPRLFQRLGLDPAVASGPLVTTATDITGILIYFGLAYWLVERLVA